jgi:hypothetical protein
MRTEKEIREELAIWERYQRGIDYDKGQIDALKWVLESDKK